jgi:hypothetical protein
MSYLKQLIIPTEDENPFIRGYYYDDDDNNTKEEEEK